MKHSIIPLFIPHLGCPHQCIFCNQVRITGRSTSVEADEISKYFKNNETLIVEGPLSLDISLDKNIAQEKKYAGNIQGDADVLVVPDIVSGNGISKSLILMAEAKMAGLILGATVPIVLTSRSASDTEKKYSLILALLADKEN